MDTLHEVHLNMFRASTDCGRLMPIGVAHAQTHKGGRRQLASAKYVGYNEQSGQ